MERKCDNHRGPCSNAQAKCRDPGSNRGPSDLQSDALPTELSRLCKDCSLGKYMERMQIFVFGFKHTANMQPAFHEAGEDVGPQSGMQG